MKKSLTKNNYIAYGKLGMGLAKRISCIIAASILFNGGYSSETSLSGSNLCYLFPGPSNNNVIIDATPDKNVFHFYERYPTTTHCFNPEKSYLKLYPDLRVTFDVHGAQQYGLRVEDYYYDEVENIRSSYVELTAKTLSAGESSIPTIQYQDSGNVFDNNRLRIELIFTSLQGQELFSTIYNIDSAGISGGQYGAYTLLSPSSFKNYTKNFYNKIIDFIEKDKNSYDYTAGKLIVNIYNPQMFSSENQYYEAPENKVAYFAFDAELNMDLQMSYSLVEQDSRFGALLESDSNNNWTLSLPQSKAMLDDGVFLLCDYTSCSAAGDEIDTTGSIKLSTEQTTNQVYSNITNALSVTVTTDTLQKIEDICTSDGLDACMELYKQFFHTVNYMDAKNDYLVWGYPDGKYPERLYYTYSQDVFKDQFRGGISSTIEVRSPYLKNIEMAIFPRFSQNMQTQEDLDGNFFTPPETVNTILVAAPQAGKNTPLIFDYLDYDLTQFLSYHNTPIGVSGNTLTLDFSPTNSIQSYSIEKVLYLNVFYSEYGNVIGTDKPTLSSEDGSVLTIYTYGLRRDAALEGDIDISGALEDENGNVHTFYYHRFNPELNDYRVNV